MIFIIVCLFIIKLWTSIYRQVQSMKTTSRTPFRDRVIHRHPTKGINSILQEIYPFDCGKQSNRYRYSFFIESTKNNYCFFVHYHIINDYTSAKWPTWQATGPSRSFLDLLGPLPPVFCKVISHFCRCIIVHYVIINKQTIINNMYFNK